MRKIIYYIESSDQGRFRAYKKSLGIKFYCVDSGFFRKNFSGFYTLFPSGSILISRSKEWLIEEITDCEMKIAKKKNKKRETWGKAEKIEIVIKDA